MRAMTKLWLQDKGRFLLAVWLIATGLLPLLGMSNPHLATVMHVLAIAAGVFMLWR